MGLATKPNGQALSFWAPPNLRSRKSPQCGAWAGLWGRPTTGASHRHGNCERGFETRPERQRHVEVRPRRHVFAVLARSPIPDKPFRFGLEVKARRDALCAVRPSVGLHPIVAQSQLGAEAGEPGIAHHRVVVSDAERPRARAPATSASNRSQSSALAALQIAFMGSPAPFAGRQRRHSVAHDEPSFSLGVLGSGSTAILSGSPPISGSGHADGQHFFSLALA